MDVYTLWGVIFFLGAGAVSCGIQYYYVKDTFKTIPLVTHISLVVSIFVCILPFPLLTIDVDAALMAYDHGDTESPADSWVAVWWMVIFWGTQIMAWGVLPIAQEYDGAGQFTPSERFKHAVKENIRMYIILGVVSAVLMAYVFFVEAVYTITGMIALVMAMANAFGLTVLVIFFACGLVGVPRRLWHLSSASAVLSENYRRCMQVHEDLDINKTELTILRGEVGRRGQDPEVNPAHLAIMLDELTALEKMIPLGNTAITDRTVEDNLKKLTLPQLNAELRRIIKMMRRQHYQFKAAVASCAQLEGVVNGTEKSFYWTVLRQPLLKIAAVAAALMTLFVMWSEVVVPLSYLTDKELSVVAVVVKDPRTRFVGSVAFIYYMSGCCYWAVFRFRVFDLYELVPWVSDGASMCFIATFMTRVILPVCYNFLFLSYLTTGHTLVTYSRLFGNMDVVIFLGSWFNRFMPIFIPILAVLIEIGVIHLLMQMIGVPGFETGEASAMRNLQLEEGGKVLAARELGGELRPKAPVVVVAQAAPTGPRTSERYEAWKAEQKKKKETGADAV